MKFRHREYCYEAGRYGVRHVQMICDCEGCARMGGVTVAYLMIPYITSLDNLFESESEAEAWKLNQS